MHHRLPHPAAPPCLSRAGASPGLDREAISDAEVMVDVAVMRLPRIANFANFDDYDDSDLLRQSPCVRVRYV